MAKTFRAKARHGGQAVASEPQVPLGLAVEQAVLAERQVPRLAFARAQAVASGPQVPLGLAVEQAVLAVRQVPVLAFARAQAAVAAGQQALVAVLAERQARRLAFAQAQAGVSGQQALVAATLRARALAAGARAARGHAPGSRSGQASVRYRPMRTQPETSPGAKLRRPAIFSCDCGWEETFSLRVKKMIQPSLLT
jgi:hypothetical protein